MKKICLLLAVICSLLIQGSCMAAMTVPAAPIDGFVADQTATLTQSEIVDINKVIGDYRNETGIEIGVLMVSTIEDDYLENFSINVARSWGIGQQGKNNGVLLLIAKDDRQLRIEVGTGLEGDLTDVRASRIIRDRITPRFKEGDYFGGIKSGVDGIKLAIGAQPDLSLSDDAGTSIDVSVFFTFVPFISVFLIWIGSMLGRSKRWWPGGVIGVILGFSICFISTKIIIPSIVVAIIAGLFGLFFDYVISKNYKNAIKKGVNPSWWAGGTHFGGGSSSSSSSHSSFGGGGGFGGGGASGRW